MTKIDAKTVDCSKCYAETGTRCVTASGAFAKQPHPVRVTEARAYFELSRCTVADCDAEQADDELRCAEHVPSTDELAAELDDERFGPQDADLDELTAEATALAACTGATAVTVRRERRLPTGELVVESETTVERSTAAERVRRTVVELAPERVALVVEPQLIDVADAPSELTCVRCERTLPTSTFPTVKSATGVKRKTECRACRSARSAAGLRTDGAARGTRKPRESRSDRVSAENAQTAQLAATLDLAAIAASVEL